MRGAGLAALRRFVSSPPEERCELCAARISGDHEHLVGAEGLRCACAACALGFQHEGARLRRVTPRAERLDGVDVDWDALAVPIRLAYFWRQRGGSVVAQFPGPAGAVATSVPPWAWERLAAGHPSLRSLAQEIEGLLVYGDRERWLVSIDVCHRLVTQVRVSGGQPARLDAFFAELAHG